MKVRPFVPPKNIHHEISFNSRTREGATKAGQHRGQNRVCFNSRTREGATSSCFFAYSSKYVSIHAPVKVRQLCQIFINFLQNCFNSRTREGATRVLYADFCIWRVSIHAPVKVRPRNAATPTRTSWFQFTHP